ncbi:hypothetical protein NP233_g4656 [Leucocoprinus birnbaumii]|uniref:GST N-terminal domain-containing protein n=1 Tax=Leucocoprinus birnbaumii TaxID=56174 RepID=A0AAD5VWP5_9AGAR|nr:hypothetical protein NP233_g4656 [Leucocoprinus birnbaumii]
MITLYDIVGKPPIKCWSSNPWKARYVLNYKKLPYRSVYLDYEKVGSTVRDAGVPPSRFKPDGSPVHTSPSIIDDATGAKVTDSYMIAEYLDKQYPDTPNVFPPGTEALQAAFYQHFNDRFAEAALLLVPCIPNILEKESTLEYFHGNMLAILGKPVDQLKPAGEELEKLWGRLFALFDAMDGWYEKSSGPFLVGDQPSFGDFTVAASLMGMKILFGEESEDWKKVSAANNGRWLKLLSDLEAYTSVEN